MTINIRRAICLLLWMVSICAYANSNTAITTYSPNKHIRVTIQSATDGWTYSVSYKKQEKISASRLGFTDEQGNAFPATNWTAGKAVKERHSGLWKPVWGKRSTVEDKYNQLTLPIESADGTGKIIVTVRIYNDGAAIRYEIPAATDNKQEATAKKLRETTTFNFADNYRAWFYNGERHNIEESILDSDGERWPIMVIQAEDCFMAIHEADLTDGEPLNLTSKKGECSYSLLNNAREVQKGFKSAWRVMMCAERIETLVDSHILELLNPEPAEDFSWVRPGVCVWDWRINGAEWNGFKYTMTYPSWVKMIDFAAQSGIQHLVLDANWYGPEFSKDSDPVKNEKANDVRNIIRYGKEKGVGVWLYLNDVGGINYPIEETLKQYEEWGAAGVKYGFMNGSPEEKNRKTRNITALCAKHHLLIDFHDYPVHPYGQMRTFPNAVTREYCKAQLDGYDIFYPKTFVTSVFVNMLAGPLDMNNGFLDLRNGRTTRVDNNQPVPSTVVAEAARTQIVFSGATVIPDIPEYYEKYPSLLRFISAQKQPWRESKTLCGEIGKHIVMMRQSVDGNFLIGCATNEQGRTITIPLDFLPKGTFTAETTEDGDGANYLNNKTATKVSTRKVSRKDCITVTLAPGGGACILIQ